MKKIKYYIELSLLSSDYFLILKILIDRILFSLFFRRYYRNKFKKYGENISWGKHGMFRLIPSSVRISNPQMITLGENIQIDEDVFLQVNSAGEGIEIGNDARINKAVHIQSFSKIVIGNGVLVAPYVHISSGNHSFKKDKSDFIKDQGCQPSGSITIEQGCWIGHSAHVLGGVSIGKNSIIAANAVVTKNASDYSVMIGVPAKNIQR